MVKYNQELITNLEELSEQRNISLDVLKKTGILKFKNKEELKTFLDDNKEFKKYLGWLHKKLEKSKRKKGVIGQYIVPSYLKDGSVFFYILHNPGTDMKYDNVYLGDEVDGVYNKKTKVYGLDLLDYKKDRVYVVEGVFDRVRMVEQGYNTISLLGTSVTDYQINILKRFNEVNLCLDSDNAGDIGINTVKNKLRERNYTGIVNERLKYFGSGDKDVKDVDDLFSRGYKEIKFK